MTSTATMTYRRLGRSGLTVSRLVLGTMMFGGRTDEDELRRIIDAAAEIGVNFIDTADTYAGGRSEEIVGRAIKADRHRWVLATKLANPNGEGPNRRGLSRKWIMEELHTSLRRLDTDFIDILYLHKEDKLTPPEETVRALADLQRSGVIRYFGISNFKAWRIARICAACDAHGIDRPVVSQPRYNIINRSVEVEELPVCGAFGIGVAPYSPTARGVLTGKYALDAPPPADSRAAEQGPSDGRDRLSACGAEGGRNPGRPRARARHRSSGLRHRLDPRQSPRHGCHRRTPDDGTVADLCGGAGCRGDREGRAAGGQSRSGRHDRRAAVHRPFLSRRGPPVGVGVLRHLIA